MKWTTSRILLCVVVIMTGAVACSDPDRTVASGGKAELDRNGDEINCDGVLVEPTPDASGRAEGDPTCSPSTSGQGSTPESISEPVSVTLVLDLECRNGAELFVGGAQWKAVSAVPQEWRGLGSIAGTFTSSGDLGVFVAPGGVEVDVTTGFRKASCTMW